MGGLTRLLPALFAAAALTRAADPPSVEVLGRLPSGSRTPVRLQFKKGVLVDASLLPAGYLQEGASTGTLPFEALSGEGKRWVLGVLFPSDRWRRDGVQHEVRWPEVESIWLMAQLFTGHGQNYDKLQAANPGRAEKLRRGDLWRIPRELLSPELGGLGSRPDYSQPEDELDDEQRIAAYRAMLTFASDAAGPYAAYRLRKGEALYSSVVMRYTDRVDPKEVHDLAAEIAQRSGIAEVRSIQPGSLIKIPVRHLADPFQPEGSTALNGERELRDEVRRTVRIEAGPRLKGVRVVLDAGHGGIDPGARANGVWESDFVYDITMRVRRLLEMGTDASVSCTVRYPAVGFRTRDRIEAPSREAQILTTPPFASDGEHASAVGVHLRWVLANDWFTAFQKAKGEARKTLFISFHADSLHPTASGTMVYVPGAAHVPERFALAAGRGAGVQEMKRGSRVAFSGRERLQNEARSRLLAEGLLRELRQARLPIHSNRPIRNVIHRGGGNYVPAVIRHNVASAKLLLEVCNLNNLEDAERLQDPDFRERYAAAVVKAIRGFYAK